MTQIELKFIRVSTRIPVMMRCIAFLLTFICTIVNALSSHCKKLGICSCPGHYLGMSSCRNPSNSFTLQILNLKALIPWCCGFQGQMYCPNVVRIGSDDAPISDRARHVKVEELMQGFMELPPAAWHHEYQTARAEVRVCLMSHTSFCAVWYAGFPKTPLLYRFVYAGLVFRVDSKSWTVSPGEYVGYSKACLYTNKEMHATSHTNCGRECAVYICGLAGGQLKVEYCEEVSRVSCRYLAGLYRSTAGGGLTVWCFDYVLQAKELMSRNTFLSSVWNNRSVGI